MSALSRLGVIIGLTLALVGTALAADPVTGYRSSYCPWHQASDILTLQQSEIEDAVQTYFDQATAELASKSVVASYKPAFVWASEAKFSCNKALGYFKTGTLDEESVQKCDCFFRRMTTYR